MESSEYPTLAELMNEAEKGNINPKASYVFYWNEHHPKDAKPGFIHGSIIIAFNNQLKKEYENHHRKAQ